MTTEIILTGTGMPNPDPNRAGAGVLVRYQGGGDPVALQVDAGRGTTMRLTELKQPLSELNAVLLTHYHSDHLVGLQDLVLTRWVMGASPVAPLPIVAPAGATARFAERMLDVWDDDLAVRSHHTDRTDEAAVAVTAFDVTSEPAEVTRFADVIVEAVAVHHEPVEGAVAFRITTPDGVVVISGDTRVCEEVERAATGADVLVHEVARTTAMMSVIAGTKYEAIFEYHADSVDLGAMAERAGVPTLMLTHLIPAPNDEAQEASFEDDVRAGGYQGRVIVGRDLMRVTIGD